MNITISKNDTKARIIIFIFSIVVFLAVTALERVTLDVDLGFNEHVFAELNAIINTMVAFLLLAGIITAKKGRYVTHKKIMLTAMGLSVLFLLSYICHHLFAGSTLYGDVDKNGVVRHELVNDLPLGRNIDEALRIVDALQHNEKYGEVCPANWEEGEEAMSATVEGVKEYLSKK